MSKSRFVLKPAKVGGSGASDLTRYVAKKDLDRWREGERARPLFDEARDDLTFWEARKHLSITGGALPREDVMHYVLSFEVLKDYNLLGVSDAERRAQIRAHLRSALAKAAKEMGIERWRWAAGIHLNRPHPHVHILINKTVVDRRTGELRRVEKLPKPTVAHNKDVGDKTREFDYGTIINSFAEGVDARLRERALNDRNGRQLGEAKAQRERLSDRILLGESMWARYLVGRLERETVALKTHGDKRRFRLFDPTHDRVRHVSAHDIRRRATAEANRSVAGVKFSSPAERENARQQFFNNNLARHNETLAEHGEKVEGHLARLESRLDQARQNYRLLQPHIENLRARYKEKGEPLPLPILSREQVGKLQDEAVEAHQPARIRTLEKIRQALSAEHGSPARTPHERGRLAAQLREAETDLQARASRERQFEGGFHLTRWEIGNDRFSLAGVDAKIEKERVQTSFVHAERAARGLERAGLLPEDPSTVRSLTRIALDPKRSQEYALQLETQNGGPQRDETARVKEQFAIISRVVTARDLDRHAQLSSYAARTKAEYLEGFSRIDEQLDALSRGARQQRTVERMEAFRPVRDEMESRVAAYLTDVVRVRGAASLELQAAHHDEAVSRVIKETFRERGYDLSEFNLDDERVNRVAGKLVGELPGAIRDASRNRVQNHDHQHGLGDSSRRDHLLPNQAYDRATVLHTQAAPVPEGHSQSASRQQAVPAHLHHPDDDEIVEQKVVRTLGQAQAFQQSLARTDVESRQPQPKAAYQELNADNREMHVRAYTLTR